MGVKAFGPTVEFRPWFWKLWRGFAGAIKQRLHHRGIARQGFGDNFAIGNSLNRGDEPAKGIVSRRCPFGICSDRLGVGAIDAHVKGGLPHLDRLNGRARKFRRRGVACQKEEETEITHG